jgi:hypothetical protein
MECCHVLQENELDSSRSKCNKIQRDHEILMIEKSDRIKELQDQVSMFILYMLSETIADIFACLLDLNFKRSKLTRLNF